MINVKVVWYEDDIWFSFVYKPKTLSLFYCPASFQTSHPTRTWILPQIFQRARSLRALHVNHSFVSVWAGLRQRGGGSGAELETVTLSLVFSVVDLSLLSFQCVRAELIVAFVVRERAEDPLPPSFLTRRSGVGSWLSTFHSDVVPKRKRRLAAPSST